MTMKKQFIFLSILALGLIGLFIWIYAPMCRHNQMGKEYMKQLSNAPLDKSDKLCDKYIAIGLLCGNGNHCDILCLTFWQSDIPLQELCAVDSKYKVIFATDEDALNHFFKDFAGVYAVVKSKLQLVNCTYILVDWHSLMPDGDLRCY